jgi:hypothetical protein
MVRLDQQTAGKVPNLQSASAQTEPVETEAKKVKGKETGGLMSLHSLKLPRKQLHSLRGPHHLRANMCPSAVIGAPYASQKQAKGIGSPESAKLNILDAFPVAFGTDPVEKRSQHPSSAR